MPPPLFSPASVTRHRARVQARGPQGAPLHPLHEEIGKRLLERVEDGGIGGEKGLVCGNSADFLVERLQKRGFRDVKRGASPAECACNPSFLMAELRFNLVLSFLDLHFVNDISLWLELYRKALTPDGAFLAVFWGGESLSRTRHTLTTQESNLCGGLSPRFAPLMDLQTASQLLQQAGFRNPVADREVVRIEYPNLLALCREIRAVGEANPLNARPRTSPPRGLFFTENEQPFQDDIELFYLFGRG